MLRERCFVTIPQDAILSSHASLRFNLDPTESLSDMTLLDVLGKVRLMDHFFDQGIGRRETAASSSGRGPEVLGKPLLALPALSVGQGQLLALARSLLQVHHINTSGALPIVLLDEATSSLDAETEELILGIVHGELTLRGFTVMMVAHRLRAAAVYMQDEDLAVWMQDGQIVNVGTKADLLG